MTPLAVGDTVRVKALPRTLLGTIVSISTRMRHSRYLVAMPGMEPRGYRADELEQVTPPAVGAEGREGP